MNFKERIQIINQTKVEEKEISEFKESIETLDIFVKNKTVDRILKNAVSKSKNIILMSSLDCDNLIVSNYIRNFLPSNFDVDIILNMATDFPKSKSNVAIVPEPSLNDVVKIFELILCDYKSFVFSLNLKTFSNVLESLRTLVSLTKSNLSANSVEHLIGVSESLLVYVSKNEDGLFEVNDIGKIVYKNNSMFLDILYSQSNLSENSCSEKIEYSQDVVEITSLEIKEEDSSLVESIEVSPSKDNDVVVEQEIENAVIEEDAISSSEQVVLVEDVEPIKKVNKYKALKEKIKAKKQSVD